MSHPRHPAPVTTADGEIRPAPRAPARERWSWAIYDFANTIFSMNVATLYFAVWLVSDLGASNTSVAIGSGIASLLVALSIPALGAISDARQQRVVWVIGWTLLAIVATALIGIAGQAMLPAYGEGLVNGMPRPEGWTLPGSTLAVLLIAFIVANYSYQAALPFYNAMLPELVPPKEQGRLSGIGTAVGYVGSIAGVLLVTPFFTGALPLPGSGPLPASFMENLRSIVPFTSSGGRVATFVPTALLYLLFALPLFLFCRDHRTAQKVAVRWREAFASVFATFRDASKHPGALRFIIASFLYQDAMGTIIAFMALYAVEAMGFAQGLEATLLITLTVPAVFGSVIIGYLIDGIGATRRFRLGPKRALVSVLIAWIVLLIAMMVAPGQRSFWVVGFFIGLIYGGIATAERPLLLSLVPDVEAGKYFGLMVLSARAAAIAGPLIWGVTVDGLTPSMGKPIAYRAAVGTVAIAMIIALFVLRKVPDRSRSDEEGAAARPASS